MAEYRQSKVLNKVSIRILTYQTPVELHQIFCKAIVTHPSPSFRGVRVSSVLLTVLERTKAFQNNDHKFKRTLDTLEPLWTQGSRRLKGRIRDCHDMVTGR
jgi:hypothetical protein